MPFFSLTNKTTNLSSRPNTESHKKIIIQLSTSVFPTRKCPIFLSVKGKRDMFSLFKNHEDNYPKHVKMTKFQPENVCMGQTNHSHNYWYYSNHVELITE